MRGKKTTGRSIALQATLLVLFFLAVAAGSRLLKTTGGEHPSPEPSRVLLLVGKHQGFCRWILRGSDGRLEPSLARRLLEHGAGSPAVVGGRVAYKLAQRMGWHVVAVTSDPEDGCRQLTRHGVPSMALFHVKPALFNRVPNIPCVDRFSCVVCWDTGDAGRAIASSGCESQLKKWLEEVYK